MSTDELEQAEAAQPPLPPGPATGFGEEIPLPTPARPFAPENVPCLRDCEHFMAVKTYFEHGNPAGTFADGGAPMQNHYWCTAMSGNEPLELTADAPVYECNRWDPRDSSEIQDLLERQQHYLNCQAWEPMPTTTTEGHDDSTTPGDGPD